jgi:membrane-associated phospholipid phosphatase
MDLWLLKVLNGLAALSDGFEDPFEFLANQAELMFGLLLAAAFLARGRLASVRARHGVVAAGLSALLALAVAHLISGLWDRPRPYEALGDVHLFVAPSVDPSFPSDHATAAFAIAVALLLRNRRVGAVALMMAVVLSLSRVAVGVHYPSDILGGAVIGSLAALALWMPPVRGPLHAVANRVSDLYERLSAGASRLIFRAAPQ